MRRRSRNDMDSEEDVDVEATEEPGKKLNVTDYNVVQQSPARNYFHHSLVEFSDFKVEVPESDSQVVNLLTEPYAFARYSSGWQLSNKQGQIAALMAGSSTDASNMTSSSESQSTDKMDDGNTERERAIAFRKMCREKKKEYMRQISRTNR